MKDSLPDITSRDVTREIARFANWPASDLRTRERWLIEGGVIPAGKGRTGAASIKLRHGLMILIALAAPKAIDTPKYVAKVSRLRGKQGRTLMQALEEFEALYERDVTLMEVRLPIWDGYLGAEVVWQYVSPGAGGLKTETELFWPVGPRPTKPGIRLSDGRELRRIKDPDPMIAKYLYVDGLVIGALHELFREGELT